MRVAIRPAWHGGNAFCALLADALVSAGLEVAEWRPGWRHVPAGDALLVHWPDEWFDRRDPRRDAGALLTLARIAVNRRMRGQRLVWLVHNLIPHERDRRPFTRARRLFLSLLDGVIFLSQASRAAFIDRYPALATLPHLVTVHGHYRDRATAPPIPMASPEGPVRLALVGRLRRYKAPDALAALVDALPPRDVRLVIAGECADPQLRRTLASASARSDRITLALGTMDAVAFERRLDEADAVIAPYRAILNSGTALHALSRGRPFIAPRLGSLPELAAMVGDEWVYLYDGTLTATRLSAAIRWVRETRRPPMPDLSAFDWPPIGVTTARWLCRLESNPRAIGSKRHPMP